MRQNYRRYPDLATPEGQKALLAACPDPDILVNNNGGPPPRDFRELTRQQMIDGVIANMVVAIELIQKTIGPMTERRFGRIVNITSGSVKMPLAGLDLSSGAFDTDRLRSVLGNAAKAKGISADEAAAQRALTIPARRFGQPAEFGAACAFLCSASAGYITGQNLLIDGGVFNGAF